MTNRPCSMLAQPLTLCNLRQTRLKKNGIKLRKASSTKLSGQNSLALPTSTFTQAPPLEFARAKKRSRRLPRASIKSTKGPRRCAFCWRTWSVPPGDRVRLAADCLSLICAYCTQAGKGNVIGGDFKDLADIIALVDNKSRVGVTLDTCHAFAWVGHLFTFL